MNHKYMNIFYFSDLKIELPGCTPDIYIKEYLEMNAVIQKMLSAGMCTFSCLIYIISKRILIDETTY